MEAGFATNHLVMVTAGSYWAAAPELGQERITIGTNLAVASESPVDVTTRGLHRPYELDCNFQPKRQG